MKEENIDDKKKLILGEDSFESKIPKDTYIGKEITVEENYNNIEADIDKAEDNIKENVKESVKKTSSEYSSDYEKKSSEFLEKEKSNKSNRHKNFFITVVVLIVIFGILNFLAPTIHRSLFAAENSILFLSGNGIFNPRVGLSMFVVALLIIIAIIYSMFTGKKKNDVSLSKKEVKANNPSFRLLGFIIALVLILVSVMSLFTYQDLTAEHIVNRSLFGGTRIHQYDKVLKQEVTYNSDKKLIEQAITLDDNAVVKYPFTKDNKDKVKLIDQKYNPSRNKLVDTHTFQQIINDGLYTQDQAESVYR